MTIASAALLLFLILDPLGNIPVFLSLLKPLPAHRRRIVLARELLIAFGVLMAFLWGGKYALELMHLRQESVSIAGGIVLFLIGIRMIFPRPEGLMGEIPDGEPFIVPLAIPLVAGPSGMAAVMLRAFKMQVGKDYKVISFQGETERIAALINGDIQGGLISVPHAPKALNAGMKILVRTGDYIQRAGGSLWARKAYIDQNPDVPPKLIRAIAKAVMFYRTDKAGSIPILKNHLGIDNDKDAGIVWDQTHNAFGAELPKDLFRQIFESRRKTMIAAKQWSTDKPLPDPEQFLMRDVLDKTLKDMKYVPTPPGSTN